MRFYTKLVENNDHEGEEWTFWLEIANNSRQLEALANLILNDDPWAQYELDLNVSLAEEEVDVLVEYGGEGYMKYHNKVSGTFTCPDDIDLLYKGGIEDFYESND